MAPHNESRYKHQAERIGMHAVYADNAVQVIGNQGTAGTEKHDQYHESVSDDGFMVMEWFQTDVWLLLCPLPVDKKGKSVWGWQSYKSVFWERRTNLMSFRR